MLKLLKYAAIAALTILIMTAAFLLYLTTSGGEEVLRNYVENKVNSKLDYKLEIAQLETNLFSRLQLKGIRIFRKEPTHSQFAELSYIKAEYSIFDLFRSKLVIRNLLVDSLRINLDRDNTGQFKLPTFTSSPNQDTIKSPSSFTIAVKNAEIRKSTVHYNDRALALDSKAGSIQSSIYQDDSGSYQFESSIDTIKLVYSDSLFLIDHFVTSGHFSSNILNVKSLKLGLPGFTVVGELAVDLTKQPPTLQGKVTLEGTPGPLVQSFKNHIPEILNPVSGDMTIDLLLNGSTAEPDIQVDILFPNMTLGRFQVDNGRLHCHAGRHRIDLQSVSFNSLMGEVTGSGSLGLDSLSRFEAHLDVENLNLNGINESLLNSQAVYNGRISGKLKAAGSLKSLESAVFDGRLSINRIRYREKPIPDFELQFTSQEGNAALDIRQGDTRIQSSIRFVNDKTAGDFIVNIPDLTPIARLVNVDNLSGIVEIRGSIQGAIASPSFKASFTGKNLKYHSVPLDMINGSLIYNDGNLTFGKTFFQSNINEFSEFRQPVDLSDFRGAIQYQGEFSGNPVDLVGNVLLNLEDFEYRDYRIKTGLVVAEVAHKRIELTKLQLENDSLQVDARGSITLDSLNGSSWISIIRKPEKTSESTPGTSDAQQLHPENMGDVHLVFSLDDHRSFSLEAHSYGLRLELLPYAVKVDNDISGMLDLNLAFQGSFGKPHIQSDFSLTDFRYDVISIDSITGNLNLTDGILDLEHMRIKDRNNAINLNCQVKPPEGITDGKLQFNPDSRISGYIGSESFDLGFLSDLVTTDYKYDGTAEWSLHIDGSINQPSVRGTVFIIDGSLILPDAAPPLGNLQLLLILDGNSASIKSFSGKVREKPFFLTGDVSTIDRKHFKSRFDLDVLNRRILSGSGEIGSDSIEYNLAADDLDLSLLNGLDPNLATLQGSISAGVKFSGLTTDFDITGNINCRDVQLRPGIFDAPLSDGRLLVRFDRKKVLLDTLGFKFKDGWVLVNGSAVRQDSLLASLNLHIFGEKLRFRQPKQYQVDVKSIDLDYTLKGDQYELNGDIILDESRLTYRFQTQMLISLLQKTDAPRPPLPDIIRKTKFNVRLRESDRIWIDNNLARMRLHSELTLTGSPERPNLNGRLMVVEGYVVYLDRKFQIKTGILDFADPVKPNPYVTLTAETDVRNYSSSSGEMYKVTLEINGKIEEAIINLYSDPPLEKSDILSLLTLGMTMEKPADARSTGKSGALAEAVKGRLEETSSNRISGYVSRKTESALGLDQVSLQGNLFNINNTTGPQLLASKKITPRMEITYTTTIGHLNEQGIRLNYSLTKSFSIEGQTDQRGNAGADLKYRIKF